MPSFVEQVIARVVDEQVEFLVVGGLSAVLKGAPVVTQDLDICYRRTPDNVARLARARGIPAELPGDVDEHTLRQGTNFTLEVSGEALDLLGEMSGVVLHIRARLFE